MLDFSKQALKRATLWFARESKKPDGSSSYKIAEKVKKEFDGVGPHAATIRKYVEANLQGMIPFTMPRIQELRSHPAAQLPPGRDHLQEAHIKDKPSPQEGLHAEDVTMHSFGDSKELGCINNAHC